MANFDQESSDALARGSAVIKGVTVLLFRKIAFCIGVLALPVVASAQSIAPQTTWINDHAQLVIQSIDPDGRLTGTYENFGPNFGCAGQKFPITGWVDADKVTYAVRRKSPGNCSVLQSWIGYVSEGELRVEFNLVVSNGTQHVVRVGTDRYRRQ